MNNIELKSFNRLKKLLKMTESNFIEKIRYMSTF